MAPFSHYFIVLSWRHPTMLIQVEKSHIYQAIFINYLEKKEIKGIKLNVAIAKPNIDQQIKLCLIWIFRFSGDTAKKEMSISKLVTNVEILNLLLNDWLNLPTVLLNFQ